MKGQFRRVATAAVASILVASQAGAPANGLPPTHVGTVFAQAGPRGHVSFTPPLRLDVKEPKRIKPVTAPARMIRAKVVAGTRSIIGRSVITPQMLTPVEIGRRVAAARRTASALPQRLLPPTAPAHNTGFTRGGRQTKALTQNGGPFNTTGITPWWDYHEDTVPGGGHLLLNVGLGNLIVQDDDMAIPHKGIAMTFERTYNAQAGATSTSGSSVTWTSVFGNGWTNTLDAHLLATSSSTISVYDIDGARYDYASNGSGGYVSQTPGQHGTLTYDGNCGMYWTKKSGMIYYFFDAMVMPACTMTPSSAGYFGRLYAIFGHNYNTYLIFTYSWDNGDASSSSKLSSMHVQSESGMVASLAFGDVGGRRLLQTLTFPDTHTAVSYGYDSVGNLTSVTKPANNSAGATRQVWYGYTTLGADSVMGWASSPRWAVQCNMDNCGGDGAYLGFAYSGSSAATSSLTSIQNFGVVNPTIDDGYAAYGALQSGYPTYAYAYRTEYYNAASWNQYTQTGYWQSTFRDTDGHMVNWIVDSAGRVTQMQVCPASSAQGTQCPASSWLTTSQSWDANNNVTKSVNARGGATDTAYDANGNPVAIAQPPQYQTYARPTTLIDYDGFSNVTAICDPVLVHSGGRDWPGQYTAGADNYCSGQFGTGHWSIQFAYASSEPFGRPVSETSPGGYVRTISYDTIPQAGGDYGLPTKIAGAPILQLDQSSRVPSVSATYDGSGNIVCLQTDAGTGSPTSPAISVMTYDSLNRLIAQADPDDASLTGSCTGKSAGISGSTIVNTRSYFADGSLATTQSPSEAALGYGTVFTYDVDGNSTSESPYHPNPQSSQTARMKRWFDGMDRLVETQEPPDPGTAGDMPISMRYLYDLSQANSAATVSGTTVSAHGNLFDTLKNTAAGWIDFKYSAFDSADRTTTAYAFAPCPAQTAIPQPTGPIYCNQAAYATRYDWDTSQLPSVAAPGQMVATLDATGAAREITYDGLNNIDSINYSGDGGLTAPVSYAYDFDGRLATSWDFHPSALPVPATNQVAYTYTSDGMLAQAQNVSLNTTTGYSYYPDASLAGVSATAGSIVNQPNLYRYAYRNDGLVRTELFGASNQAMSWTYTLGGRMTATTDFSGSPSIFAQYSDGHGRMSSYTTPAGNYGSIAYDSQGRILQYTDPYNAVDGETVSATYNIRGDLVAQTFSGGNPGAKPGFHYPNIQGVAQQNPSDQFDGRTGAPLIIGSWSNGFSYDAMGRLKAGAGALSYDAESRLVAGDTWNYSTAPDMDCPTGGFQNPPSDSPRTAEVSYAYDAIGRVLQDKSRTGSTTAYRQWFWHGTDVLYTVSMLATGGFSRLTGYGADGLGSIPAGGSSPGLTISDVGLDGSLAQYHNATGHSTWFASNTYNQYCQSAVPLPASPNYVGPSGNPPATDGSSDPSLIVQSSGRAFLSSAMGYTTPDYSSATPYAASSRSASSSGRVALFRNDRNCGLFRHWNNDTHKCVDDPNPFENIPGGDPFGSGRRGAGAGSGPHNLPKPAPTPPPLCMAPNGNLTREAGYINPPNCRHLKSRSLRELGCTLLGAAAETAVMIGTKEPKAPVAKGIKSAGGSLVGPGVAMMCMGIPPPPEPLPEGGA